jgi:purine-binding chemotaxis protein CheW
VDKELLAIDCDSFRNVHSGHALIGKAEHSTASQAERMRMATRAASVFRSDENIAKRLEGNMNAQGESQATVGKVKQLISFAVAHEEYGFELQHVKEVIRMREVTWLPEAPSCVQGIVNLRGQVIPIIDLREKFGLEHVEATAETRVIVVEQEEGSAVGMMVDSASQVIRLPESEFEPPPAVLSKVAQDYIAAVGKRGDRLITVLDVGLLPPPGEIPKRNNHVNSFLQNIRMRADRFLLAIGGTDGKRQVLLCGRRFIKQVYRRRQRCCLRLTALNSKISS